MYYSKKNIKGISFQVIANSKGISNIYINEEERNFNCIEVANDNPFLFNVFKELEEYFNGERKKFDVPIDFKGTKFQTNVWKALKSIPYGKTSCYGDIAAKVNSPGAVRATGTAIGRNPIPIIIPCHRVINKNGKIGGFACGLDVKRALMAVEKIVVKE